jgi:hypothetical protein
MKLSQIGKILKLLKVNIKLIKKKLLIMKEQWENFN